MSLSYSKFLLWDISLGKYNVRETLFQPLTLQYMINTPLDILFSFTGICLTYWLHRLRISRVLVEWWHLQAFLIFLICFIFIFVFYFFHFFKILIFWVVRGWKVKKRSKMKNKNYIRHAPYLRNSVETWYLQALFLFFQHFDFSGH